MFLLLCSCKGKQEWDPSERPVGKKRNQYLNLLRDVRRTKYTIVYKRGGHAPCSYDVTLKKDDENVDVDHYNALGGGMIKAEDNSAKEHTLNHR